jgi:FtsP/CotA-like multicopper oxidase with cupredoxin domain
MTTKNLLLRVALAILTALPGGAAAQIGTADVPADAQPLPELPVLSSEGGQLNATLRLAYAPNVILSRRGDDRVLLRSYNGGLVGPVLSVRPGDVLNLLLQNALPCLKEPCVCRSEAAPDDGHGHHAAGVPDPSIFNTTNLHTHGLHVSPKDPADNVLREIRPGCAWQFRFDLPQDHPAGTFWYHPHVHGSTAIQVGSGAVGALIVRGGIDEVPEIKAARERILLFQQIPYTCRAREANPDTPCTPADPGRVEHFSAFGRDKWPQPWQSTTINGAARPAIYMQPGEVQRWRMIHGGVRESIHAAVASRELEPLTGWLHEIALDGLPTGEVAARTSVELQPGYRADVLVRAPEAPGFYYLLDQASAAEDSLLAEPESQKILALIVVGGEGRTMRLPTNAQVAPFRLPSVRDEEVAGRPRQEVEFDIRDGRFLVDGEEFPGKTRYLELGKADEWLATSKVANHPFHIHVNPFEVIETLPDGRERRTWRDTILVKERQKVRFRSRYTRFDGKFVLHCHILDHEDQGMMQFVEIRP